MSPPDEELLSAYLDGELSADERSRVEQWLAESPESRQLLDELRSIRTSLERLPRARLGHEFADEVLRQAEKELLSVTAGAEGDAVESAGQEARVVYPSGRTETADRPGRVSWGRLRRPVIWASLTLAAGLLIMFLDLDRDRAARLGHHVAMAPGKVQEREDERRAGGERAAEEGTELGVPAAALHDSLEISPETSTEAKGQTDDYRPSDLSATGVSPPAAVPSTVPEYRQPASASAAGRAMAPAVAKPAQTGSEKDARRGLEENLGRKDGTAGDLAGDDLQLLVADTPTLIVWCDVAPGTNYSESFRELLAEQDIRWEAKADETEALVRDEARLADNGDEAKLRPADEKAAESELGLRGADQSRQKRLADAEQAVRDSSNEVVLVEAGQPQIEAVLAAIDGAANVFVNVEVTPPPEAPEQQRQLERFARGKVSPEKLGEPGAEAPSKAKKREDPSLARSARPVAGEENQKQAAAGIARRLATRAAATPDKAAKKEEPKDDVPSLGQLRKNSERDAPNKKSADGISFGLGGANQQAADKDRVQVLFVLHPVEASSTPADAKPSNPND